MLREFTVKLNKNESWYIMEKKKSSKQNRSNILTNIMQCREVVTQLAYEIEDAPNDKKLQKYLMQELDKLDVVEQEYLSLLPCQIISRSPFTQEPYKLSIDTVGLDGFWWDSEEPIRDNENNIQSFFALTGSVNINKNIPNVPFPIRPGPAVPWVCPRLLEDERIVAVISHLKVGNYDAYITVYYTSDDSIEIERINTWGSDYYIAEDKDGYALFGNTFDTPEEYDFNIAPWIKKGKVKWIDIADESLTLHDSVKGCPYLNLEGYRYPVLIRNKTITNCMIELEYEEENEVEEENFGFCTNCGKPLPKGAKFCPYCGAKVLTFKGGEL